MRPPFRYFGGKARVAPWIVSMFPSHNVYIEPFLGAGAVMFAKPPSRVELVNDLDDMVANFYRVLRDQPDELINACRLTPYARNELNWSRTRYDDTAADPVERARRFFTVVSQSFACTTGSSSGFSASMKQSVNRAKSTHRYIDRFTEITQRLRDVQVESMDAARLIDIHGTAPSTLIYCDPPYVHSSRGNDSTTTGHGYRHEMTDADHKQLANALHATPATVLLSGYQSELYDEIYNDWHQTTRNTYSTTSGIAGADHHRTEVIWSNRPIHDGRLPL